MAKQTYTTGQVLTAAQMTALQANDYNWTVSAKTASYVLVAADAGTRITMSNAGATTITVNTALFTAGDTLTITNIGAGACTITAGTATVSTAGSLILNQYDSGTLYFSSTSAAIWNGANPGDITGITTGATSGLAGGVTSGTASLTLATAAKGDLLVGTGANTAQVLTVGSNNQILVADNTTATGLKWATASSGGGMTLLTSGSLTGSSVTTSSLAGGYINLVVFIKDISWSQDNYTQWRLNGDSTSGNYKWVTTYGTSASAATSVQQSASAFWADAAVSGEDAADINRFYCFTVWDYTNTVTRKTVSWNGFTNDNAATYFANEMASGTYMATPAAITTVTFFTGGGTFSGGTYEVYGVK